MDDDLIAYLEKKIKALEAECNHWKANHDNQVKLKHEITRRPSRFVEMVKEIESLKAELASRDVNLVAHAAEEQPVSHGPDPQDRAARVIELVAEIERLKAELKSFDVNHSGESQLSFFIQRAKEFEEKASRFRVLIDKSEERSRSLETEIESLKKQLAAVPHWVPVAEWVGDYGWHYVAASNGLCYDARRKGGRWFAAYTEGSLGVDVTHVLVGLNPPVSNEDPRGDGDLLPESERLDRLTSECMRDEFDKMIEVTRKMDEPQESENSKRDLIVAESPSGLWHVWEQKTHGDYTMVAGPFNDSELAHGAVGEIRAEEDASNDLAGDASDIERAIENNRDECRKSGRVDFSPMMPQDAIRDRLLQPFLGSEAEKLGAKTYRLRDGERWEYLSLLGKWETAKTPVWYRGVKYRLATGEQHDDATD